MIKSAKWIVIVAILMLGFGGCATITNTPKQQVSLVASNGEKVVVTINEEKVTLPTTMKIPRKPTDVYVYAEDNPGYQYSHTSTFVIGGIKESPVVFFRYTWCSCCNFSRSYFYNCRSGNRFCLGI